MTTSKYSTDLSDAEWDYLEAHLPARNNRGRPRIHTPREILDAVFLLRLEERLSVETVAPRLPTVEDRLPLLPSVASGRDLGATTRRAARSAYE